MEIPFFNYADLFKQNKKEFIKIFEDVCSRGAFILQKDLLEFEHELAKFTGAKFAVGVGNATDGLQLALMAGNIEKNSEIIISSHTMIATASAIHHIGCKPIPVEAGSDLNIDCDNIESAITSKTKAIMPTHLNGRTCNMDNIMSIAKKHDLEIYEDAAQGLGSSFKGKSAGTFGVASAISFYPAKNLGSFGDAGAVLTNDKKIYEKLMMLRDHGRNSSNGEISCWGVNSRLDNLQAAFLKYILKDYEKIINRRREIAKNYHEELSTITEIELPPAPNDGVHFDVFQNYEIKAKKRDDLKEFLNQKGIGTLIQWSGKAIHHFTNLGFNQKCPNTDRLFNKILMIPMNMFITDDQVMKVCKSIKEFYSI